MPTQPAHLRACSVPAPPAAWQQPPLPVCYANVPSLPPLPDSLAQQVFAHKSSIGTDHSRSHEYESRSYKPLEFYGDAVAEFHVTRVLRKGFPDAGPGVLTSIRGSLLKNVTLAYLGWGLGFPSRIRYGANSPLAENGGANAPQSILAEVFEAYVGACMDVPALQSLLEAWFDEVFSPQSQVFPELQLEVQRREDQLRTKREHKHSGNDRQRSSVTRTADSPPAKWVKRQDSPPLCDCPTRPSATTGFHWLEDDHGPAARSNGRVWHSTLFYNDTRVACGSGAQRLVSREEAWAAALRQHLPAREHKADSRSPL